MLYTQLWRVYGRHEQAPAASINFMGMKFYTGRKHMRHPCCGQKQQHAFEATDERTHKQTNIQKDIAVGRLFQ